MMPSKIAAPNWRWRIQFGHRGLQSGLVSLVIRLPAHRAGQRACPLGII